MTIEVMISGHDVSIPSRLKEYIEKKVVKLERYLPELGQVRVDLSVERAARDADDRQVVQLTARPHGTFLRAEERTNDMFAAVDLALEKMQRQIEHYKARHRRGRGDGVGLATAAIEAEGEPETQPGAGPLVVRRKRYPISPMTEAEAIEQMPLLQHENFFIFYNAETAKMNVLYTRKDGTLGLIVPEVS